MIRANNIHVFNPEKVTTIDSISECDPSEVGMSLAQIATIWDSVVDFYKSGIHPSIALCIRRNGKIIINRAIGHTHGNGPNNKKYDEKIKATPDSLYNLFSASKAITAVVIHHMAEHGLINIDDLLCDYLPEFKKGPKRFITISHVLSHQSGVPSIPVEALDLDILQDSIAMRKIFEHVGMEWKAGHSHGYHALSGGFIFSELVKQVTGKSIREYLQEWFLKPLGFKSFNYGVPTEMVNQVAVHVYTGRPFPRLVEKFYVTRLLGLSYKEAIELSNDERFLTGIIPSANVIGTAEETSRFYEMLLRGGTYNGVKILAPETINKACVVQVDGFDKMMGIPVKYSQGFMLGRKHLSLYGHDTAQAFGHLGFINVVGFADPERDISVGLMNNGKPGITPHIIKFVKLLNTISNTIPKI